jgi:lipopolysaccharide export system permease protein
MTVTITRRFSSNKYEDRIKMPFVKVTTKIYPIDLSQLNKVNVDDENIANTNTMLTINELGYTLDSLQKNLKTEIVSYSENINLRTESQITISFQNGSRKKKTLPAGHFIRVYE